MTRSGINSSASLIARDPARYAEEKGIDPFLELCRESFSAFCVAVDRKYEVAAHIDIMCQAAEQVEGGTIDRLIVNCPPRHSKPILETELVLKANGHRVPLKDIRVGDRLITHTGQSQEVKEVHIQGNLPLLNITTVAGRTCKAAYDHPFLTPRGWVRADQLTRQDSLAVLNAPKVEDHSTHCNAEYILAGYFIGDGSTNGKNAAITNIDPDIIEDIYKNAESIGFYVSKYKNSYRVNKASKWLTERGLRGTSRTKRVPKWVFEGNPYQIGAFIGAYFACDGTVFKKSRNTPADGYERLHLGCEFGSVNRELLADVQHLLSRLGINSRLKYKAGKYKGFKLDTWRLTLTSAHEIAKFGARVRVVGAKRKRLDDYALHPREFDPVYFADRIESIELAGTGPCRCLNVEMDHSFVANDLVVHNTETWSIKFPAWFLGKNPDKKIMVATYGAELSNRIGRHIRNLIQSPEYQKIFDMRLSKDSSAINNFSTTQGGEFVAAGILGGLTGRGADVLLIDDPLKGFEDSMSPIQRQKVIDTYQFVLYPRLEPDARIVLVQTRWNEGDLTGWLTNPEEQEEIDDWHILSLPAIAEKDEGWRREGQALWPERWPLEKLLRKKRQHGDQDWAALYQQRPGTVEGRWFKRDWFKEYYFDPHMAAGAKFRDAFVKPFRIIFSIDTALKKDQEHDYTAIGVYLSTENADYKLFQFRKKIISAELFQVVYDMALYWRPHAILVEDTGAGTGLIQQMSIQPKVKLPVIGIKAVSAKEVRAKAAAPYIQSGHFFVPAQAPWLKDFMNEMCSFPVAAHDDQVDETTQYINWILQDDDARRMWAEMDEPIEDLDLFEV